MSSEGLIALVFLLAGIHFVGFFATVKCRMYAGMLVIMIGFCIYALNVTLTPMR